MVKTNALLHKVQGKWAGSVRRAAVTPSMRRHCRQQQPLQYSRHITVTIPPLDKLTITRKENP